MYKKVNIGGRTALVNYQVGRIAIVEDLSTLSKKYRDCVAIHTISSWLFKIDGVEFETKRRFLQDGGASSSKWLTKDGSWVSSEKKMIESFLI